MGRAGQRFCQYCGDPLDAGSEFVFLVEAQVYDERVAPLEQVKASPHYHGEPLRTCEACRASIEGNRQDLLEEAAKQETRSRLYRRFLAILGVVVLMAVLAAVVADLRR